MGSCPLRARHPTRDHFSNDRLAQIAAVQLGNRKIEPLLVVTQYATTSTDII